MKSILIINGPNLNFTGKRENDIYGSKSFNEILDIIKSKYSNINIDYFQSNIEGEIVSKIQEGDNNYQGIILNAGGYTHTSVAIRDAIASINTSVTEVHMTNLASREGFRHESLITGVCDGCIMGFNYYSYILAIEKILLTL